MDSFTLTGATVHTGDEVIQDGTIIVTDGIIEYVGSRPISGPSIDLKGLTVTSGFIDVQVNGGGDLLFNDTPTAETLLKIMDAHARFGTTQLMPTYITGPRMEDALSAVRDVQAISDSCLGIHFEGPVISKLGVHDPAYVQSKFPTHLIDAKVKTLITLAPDMVAPDVVAALVKKKAIVSIGHTDASFEEFRKAVCAGASCVTHLFNAMSQFGSRDPGVVGGFLSNDRVWGGVIADGYHAHYKSISVAYRAKPRGKLFLVTDAMPPVGGLLSGYRLGDLEISVQDGRCVTADGTLAGSALDMATAIRNCVQQIGIPKDEAFRMASRYPAEMLGIDASYGTITPGRIANLAICDDDIRVTGVVRSGTLSDHAFV
jgi:N-acetylglucosamine-6-phosphate deacetylase